MTRRILIVEDEYLIAKTMCDAVTVLGLEYVGPAPRLAAALDLAARETLDGAIVDFMLAGETADDLCALLDKRAIPFALATGLDEAGQGRWRDRPIIRKPYSSQEFRRVVEGLFPAEGAAA